MSRYTDYCKQTREQCFKNYRDIAALRQTISFAVKDMVGAGYDRDDVRFMLKSLHHDELDTNRYSEKVSDVAKQIYEEQFGESYYGRQYKS